MTEIRRRIRAVHELDPIHATLFGLGVGYLTIQAAFAVSFAHPPAIGWVGFAIVCVVVIAAMTGLGQFLAHDGH